MIPEKIVGTNARKYSLGHSIKQVRYTHVIIIYKFSFNMYWLI